MKFEHAKNLAEYDPEKYIGLELYKDPSLSSITEHLLDTVIKSTSGLFFYYNFDKISEFKKYEKRAALFLASRNPLAAILVYNLIEKPELRNDVEMAKVLLTGLIREMGGNVNDFQNTSEILADPKIKNATEQIIETIARKDPDFYQKSGLAEDTEFGKFFSHIGVENGKK